MKERADALSLCAHELRSHIRATSLYADIIREEIGGELSPDAEEAVNGIRLYCDRTLVIIEDIIGYSRSRDKPLVIEKTSLSDIIEDCMSQLRLVYRGRDIELSCGELPSLRADESLLRQALYNILDNSIKFSSKKEKSIIAIACTEQDNMLILNISDNGTGLESSSDSPFELFTRLHSREEFEGTGVGLAVVKSVIERHGGTAEIRSNETEGCTVTLTLPKSPGRYGRKSLSKGKI